MMDRHGLMIPWWRLTNMLTLEEVASRCGLHPSLVEHFIALGLLDPAEGLPRLFPPEVPHHLRRIMRLRRDLGMNYNAAALVVELLERIETLEARLRQFET